jgi:hypothetical protein
MAISISNTDADYTQIIITDNDGKAVTSYDYVKDLYDKNSFFEACVCQSIFLEAISLYYLIVKKSELGIALSPHDSKKLKEGKLTFGNTKDLIIKHDLLLDEKLIKTLKDYVTNRNVLIHKLVAESTIINFNKLFNDGDDLIFKLWGFILDTTKNKRLTTK